MLWPSARMESRELTGESEPIQIHVPFNDKNQVPRIQGPTRLTRPYKMELARGLEPPTR